MLFLVAQLGTRMYYAVPPVLYHVGVLGTGRLIVPNRDAGAITMNLGLVARNREPLSTLCKTT
jgi:hypothetical protein